MEDKDFYELSAQVEVLKASFDKDVKHLSEMLEQIKSDLWELKANTKTIHQNEVDIATLIEKSNSMEKLLESYRKQLEAKMVTKEYLENKRYKDWRIWLVVAGIVIAITFGAINSYSIYSKTSGGNDVLSSNQK